MSHVIELIHLGEAGVTVRCRRCGLIAGRAPEAVAGRMIATHRRVNVPHALGRWGRDR